MRCSGCGLAGQGLHWRRVRRETGRERPRSRVGVMIPLDAREAQLFSLEARPRAAPQRLDHYPIVLLGKGWTIWQRLDHYPARQAPFLP